jgi:hypothetical protein
MKPNISMKKTTGSSLPTGGLDYPLETGERLSRPSPTTLRNGIIRMRTGSRHQTAR